LKTIEMIETNRRQSQISLKTHMQTWL